MSAEPEPCITCSDAAEIATVVAVEGRGATVELAAGGRALVAVELVEPVSVGDRLLCHAGIALDRLEQP